MRAEGAVTALFPRAVLVLSAATFAFFGVAYLVAPDRMVALVDLQLASSTSRADVRAVYGGLEVAIALWLGACALKRERVVEGLALSAVLYAGLGAGRALGMALDDGVIAATSWRVLAAELFAAVGCAVGLRVGRVPASVSAST